MIENTQLGGVDVFDGVSVTELASVGSNINLSIDSGVLVSESVVAENTQLGDISVFSAVDVADVVSVLEIVTGKPKLRYQLKD